jgi:hypothetical protein
MTVDARINVELRSHPKTKKLRRLLGAEGVLSLIWLIAWTAANHPDGDLAGMTGEDIELAIDWPGDPGALITALTAVRFLDGEEGSFRMHDWDEHNPWAAGSPARALKARWNAVKRHHGVDAANRLVPGYHSAGTPGSSAAGNADRKAVSNASSKQLTKPERKDAASNAPSPSPSLEEQEHGKTQPHGSAPADPPGQLELTPSEPSNVTDHPSKTASEIVRDVYNELMPRCRHINVLTPKRRRRILAAEKLARAVCEEQGWSLSTEAFWRAYFTECQLDPWLRGEVTNPHNPNWKQNLDVLIAEDRFAGIMDQAIETARAEHAA